MWFQNTLLSKLLDRKGRAINEPGSVPASKLSISSSAIHQLNRLQLSASSYLRGYSIGNRPSTRRRPSGDFHEHRAYVPGDDPRFVDWKASARAEHIYVKQGQQPKEITVYLLLDCSASMAWGQPPKANRMLEVAAALGYLALAGGDRLVSVTLYGDMVKFHGPISGKGQFPGLINYYQTLNFGGKCKIQQAVQNLMRRNLSKGGLVFILSDLLDMDNLSSTFEMLPAPTWDASVLHFLHRVEIEPAFAGDFEMVDAETTKNANYDISRKEIESYKKHLQEWLNETERICVSNNLFYALIPTDWQLDHDILPHMRKLHIVKPL